VTLGPLTNLAIAVLMEPSLPRLLRRWVLMGGAFRVPGNTTPASEWNVHCDPEAARVCLAGWAAAVEADPTVPRALAMGLDVTERARLLPAHVAALASVAGDPGELLLDAGRPPDGTSQSAASRPVVRFLADALRFYFDVHDPLVVACALDPSLVRTEPAAVDVDASGGPGDGATIADWRGVGGRAANVDVAIEADADTFLRRLVERVGALAAGLPPA
jgi:purine nucleosidase